LLDTGDALVGGGKLGDQTRGEAVVAGMNLMGYDAMALGLKEAHLGLEVLRQRIEEAEFPILSANLVLTGTTSLVTEPYTFLEAGGHRLGVIGLTRVPQESGSGFQILDPQEAAARYVPEVAEQADTVIVLTNMKYRPALALAAAVPGIDLVVAAEPAQLPTQVTQAPGTGTLVVTAEQPLVRHTGRRVGKLVVTLGRDGDLTTVSWLSKAMDKRFPDDIQMKVLLDKYQP
jgi:2',3'-cyclic-nucleotide 2'-phosphodiesterase (5'-nucleotidase family)